MVNKLANGYLQMCLHVWEITNFLFNFWWVHVYICKGGGVRNPFCIFCNLSLQCPTELILYRKATPVMFYKCTNFYLKIFSCVREIANIRFLTGTQDPPSRGGGRSPKKSSKFSQILAVEFVLQWAITHSGPNKLRNCYFPVALHVREIKKNLFIFCVHTLISSVALKLSIWFSVLQKI